MNLEFVWLSVNCPLDQFPGLTTVTSDHIDVLGERAWPFPIRVYSHRLGILIHALTGIPWLTHTSGERKMVRIDPPRVVSSRS